MLKKSDKCLVQFIILLIFVFVCLIDFSSVWFVKFYNAPVFIIYSSLLLTFIIVSFGIREILCLEERGIKIMKNEGVSKEILEKAIKDLIGNKGYPYSLSEFGRLHFVKEKELEEAGATENQIDYFNKKVQETPVKGRWNKYSGD